MTKKALLVISFGTTYHDTRAKTIAAIEQELNRRLPDYDLFRSFTSRMVIAKLKKNNIEIETPTEALQRIKSMGYDQVLCQMTHVISGFEYEKALAEISSFQGKFARLAVGRPLLAADSDFILTAKAVINNTPKLKDNEALLLMGHGSEHSSNQAYTILNNTFQQLGYENIFVGTVEGYPEIADVLKVLDQSLQKIYLMPLMIVAGDHAHNDLAGEDEDSWKSILSSSGFKTETIMKGLGELQEIRDLFVQHSHDSLDISQVLGLT